MEDVIGILCETDVGLRTAEYFATTLNLRTSNGVNEARRDKYMMMEILKQNNLSYIHQILTDQWEEARKFIEHVLGGYPVVIKPSRGSGSRDVYKCVNASHAKHVFNKILGIPGYANNTVTDAILVQQFVDGTEYVVDVASSDMDHKIVGLWRHDKRDVGDVAFVYHCSEILPHTNTDVCNSLCEYAITVIEALGVKFGPSHLEIKIDNKTKKPVLIEANIGRLHGLDIIGLSNIAYGYNFAEATIHAYLDKYTHPIGKDKYTKPHQLRSSSHIHHHKNSRWENFPPRVPSHLRMFARLAHLVNSRKSGFLLREKQEIRRKIEKLDSMLGMQSHTYPIFHH